VSVFPAHKSVPGVVVLICWVHMSFASICPCKRSLSFIVFKLFCLFGQFYVMGAWYMLLVVW